MNVDKESNEQIKGNTGKNVNTEENIICSVSQYYKNLSLEWISTYKKIIFRCNFEIDLIILGNKT